MSAALLLSHVDDEFRSHICSLWDSGAAGSAGLLPGAEEDIEACQYQSNDANCQPLQANRTKAHSLLLSPFDWRSRMPAFPPSLLLLKQVSDQLA